MSTTSALVVALKGGSNIGNAWFSLPQGVRYVASGNLGNVMFFVVDKVVYSQIITRFAEDLPMLINDHKESLCFFVSYLIQIVPQHYLNSAMVFGLHTIETKKKYFHSLLNTYLA
mmetsp:Transcript_14517/g.21403  ORF Transcript_14517/g.21403 Transcript_14517/m.21403 type:complete len:115 (-) Transcript_14517:793-1137(-)